MIQRIASLAAIAFLLLGVLIIGLPGTASAANKPAVGVVNYGLLVDKHPDAAKANEDLRAEAAQAKKEYDEKAPGLNDQEKKNLDLQLGQRVELKRRELLTAVLEKVNVAVKAVAEAKGLTIVINSTSVVYGGQDITEEVIEKFGK